MPQINSLEKASEVCEKIEAKEIINKIINIWDDLNLHLEITEYFPNTEENTYIFINYLKFTWEDEIYDTSLFLSQKLLWEFTDKTYEILNEFYNEKLESLFADNSSELNKIVDFIKSEYRFYTKLYKTKENIKYELEKIKNLIWLDEKFKDVLDVEILWDYDNHKLYHSSNIEINSDYKIVIDFYELQDEYKWYSYLVNPILLDKENNWVSMKEDCSLLSLYLLWIFEYRKYWIWYKELVNLVENIAKWLDDTYLIWTDFKIEYVYERIITTL